MDYGYIIKRAWAITWKYKILWLFGFFVMSGGANYSSSPGSYNSTGDFGGIEMQGQDALNNAWDQVAPWLPVIIGVAVLVVLLAILWWVLSIAAQGALVHLVNEAEEGREVRAGLGWRAGFRNWGRVFVIYFLLMLPILVLGLLAFFAVAMPMIAAGSLEDALAFLIASMCCLIIVGIVVGLVLSFLLTVIGMLAVRHSVIEDIGPIDGLRAAWNDVRTRFKDIFLMWLVNIGLGIAYGMIVAIVAVFFGIGIAFLLFTGAIWLMVGLAFLLFLVLLVPNAVYSTFVSALWTVFYRRMTGRDGFVAPAPTYRVPPAPPVSPRTPPSVHSSELPAPPAPPEQ